MWKSRRLQDSQLQDTKLRSVNSSVHLTTLKVVSRDRGIMREGRVSLSSFHSADTPVNSAGLQTALCLLLELQVCCISVINHLEFSHILFTE